MRWEIIKKAWSLASQKFPNTKRLFVDVPEKFLGSGECHVIDLEHPEEPLGKISYQARCENGKPILSIKLDEQEEKVALLKSELQFKIATTIEPLAKKNTILASDIMAKYHESDLGEQVAYLILGHPEGLAGNELDPEVVGQWIIDHGFPSVIIENVKTALASAGVQCVARKKGKKRMFENFEKVRVVDPRIMEYNEGARVVGHKRDKELNDWYQVIVDASDKPIWVNEKQLAKNTVGSISDISIIDKGGEK